MKMRSTVVHPPSTSDLLTELDVRAGRHRGTSEGSSDPIEDFRKRPGAIRNSKLGYRGVVKYPSGVFAACITVDRKHITIGTYPTAAEAARAYDARCFAEYGDLRAINFPEEYR